MSALLLFFLAAAIAALAWLALRERARATGAERKCVEMEDYGNRLEALLLEHASLLESLLDSSGDGIYGVDLDGNCLWANPACARLTGHRDAAELKGRNMHEILHHKHPDGSPYPDAACPLQGVMRDGREVRVDNEVFWRADGTSFAVEYCSYPLRRDGKIAGVVVFFTDITGRRALEESLRHRDAILSAVAYGAERFLRAGEEAAATEWQIAVESVLSHLGEATGVSRVWIGENLRLPEGEVAMRIAFHWVRPTFPLPDGVLDEQFSWQEVDMGVEALRLRRGELLHLVRADLRPEMRAAFDRFGTCAQLLAPVKSGDEWWGVIAFDDCTVERAWPEIEREALSAAANLFGSALQARAGRAALRANLDTLGSTLEKLKRQGLEIARQNAELARTSRLKSEFLAAVTHELRTPLNHILGFADLIEAGLAGPMTAEQKNYAAEILGSGHQLLDLVNRLLELAQLDAGKTPFLPQQADIGMLLRQATAAQEAAAKSRGISIIVGSESGEAEVDARLLRRLLDELVGNAIKFNRDGGSVTLRAWAEPSLAAGGKTSVVIEVADTGEGIAAEELPHLFEPFVQLDGRLSRRHGGAGIGLALARRIAGLHGGSLDAYSTPDEGSRFILRLPQPPSGETPDKSSVRGEPVEP